MSATRSATAPWSAGNINGGIRREGRPGATPTETKRRDMTWMDFAACRGEDPELFQPVGEGGPALIQIQDAKRVCFACPVMFECRDWAMTAPIEFGVLGGLSEAERRLVKRRAARARSRMGESRASE